MRVADIHIYGYSFIYADADSKYWIIDNITNSNGDMYYHEDMDIHASSFRHSDFNNHSDKYDNMRMHNFTHADNHSNKYTNMDADSYTNIDSAVWCRHINEHADMDAVRHINSHAVVYTDMDADRYANLAVPDNYKYTEHNG